MKKIVIPLSLILSIIAIARIVNVVGDMAENAKDGDIEGIADQMTDEIVEDTKDKVMEPLWVVLINNPITWLLGIIGSAVGVKFVIR